MKRAALRICGGCGLPRQPEEPLDGCTACAGNRRERERMSRFYEEDEREDEHGEEEAGRAK